MAEIKIKDISIHGNDLFDDSEGFLDDLNEDMLDGVNGGMALDIVSTDDVTWGPVSYTTGKYPFPCTSVIL